MVKPMFRSCHSRPQAPDILGPERQTDARTTFPTANSLKYNGQWIAHGTLELECAQR